MGIHRTTINVAAGSKPPARPVSATAATGCASASPDDATGGGCRAGYTHGETDEVGWNPVINPVHVNDFQATLLHLFGLDPTELTYKWSNREQTLTDGQPGELDLRRAQPRLGDLGVERVVHVLCDVLGFLDRIAPSSLAGVRIWFPDPWPKARQRHRRLVRDDVVARLVPLLRPGGWLHLATDIDDYAAQMQRVCDDHADLTGGPIERPAWRPVTRYEARGLGAGRTVTDLWYARRTVDQSAR